MFRISMWAYAALLVAAAPAYSQMRPAPGKFFDGADANEDGTATRDEYLAVRAKSFEKLDRNSDGFIDENDAPKRRRARAQGGERIAELRKQFDQDADGRISRSEFTDGPTLMFDRADSDQNGVLDADELAAVKAAAKR